MFYIRILDTYLSMSVVKQSIDSESNSWLVYFYKFSIIKKIYCKILFPFKFFFGDVENSYS